ncbi:MAG: hypothetical protein WD016_07445 [Balneolaceae bacterium]
MIIGFITSFLLPVILALMITPWVIRFAHKIGALDSPGKRKVHKEITPRLGGLAIFCSVIVSVISIYAIFPEYFSGIQENIFPVSIVALGFATIFVLGFWDDLKSLSPGVKFGIQFLIATLVYYAGFKISFITNPIGEGILNVELFKFPLTLLWIVGITNAFNLIDGLDGLSSGVATIACISIFTVSALSGQIWIAVLALILAGSLVGFLRYNFRPAKIFLGDSGSLIIGFSLALMSIQSATKMSTGFALLFPLLVLGLPITDTIISMIRRFLGSYLPNKNGSGDSFLHNLHGMFRPDSSHIHHQLISLGLTHRNSVIVLYIVSAVFALGAFSITQIESKGTTIAFGLIFCAALFLGIKKLQYQEIAIFNNGLLMPLYERWIINRSTFLSLIDLSFIAIAYCLSYFLIYSINPEIISFEYFNYLLAAVLCVQLSTFWLTGIYRETIRQMGIGNALAITASVFYAALATALVLVIVEVLPLASTIQFLILDFYFLLTLTLGFRIAYRALCYWFNREKRTGENVLIYGANDNGTMILHKINNSNSSNLKVLGFLDEDPELEGKLINGYPIIGGHWHLGKILRKNRVDSIFICDQNIKSENFRRLKTLANHKRIKIKRLQVSLKNINSQNENKESVNESVISYI